MEELVIRKIECGIRGIRMGTKNPDEVNVGKYLSKLKEINDGLYDDYLEKYKRVMKMYNQKNLNR